MHILLVEDHRALAETVASALTTQGWRVDVSERGEPVPRSLQSDAYDAVVLDIGLPDVDGLETLRRIRAQGSFLPVLLLTARDGVEDRVRGLEAGADDYLVKPFAIEELVARLRALVRRHEFRSSATMVLAELRLDTNAHRAWIGERPLALSARELVVLPYLMLHSGQVVPREQLTALIPGWTPMASDNALELVISRLRAKIEPAGVRLRTVRGLGYLLEAET